MASLANALKKYRDISIEAPADALPPPISVPEGMAAWENSGNGFTVVACHYTADPKKRNDAWYTDACRNLRPDQVERELEINFDSKAGAKAFPYLEHNESLFRADPPRDHNGRIPANWKIIAGLDYGARNPTSIHWYAVDEHRRFWSFDEFYSPLNKLRGGLPALAQYLLKHPYYDRLQFISADPSIFNKSQNVIETKEAGAGTSYGTLMSVADLLIKEGIFKLRRANNDRIAGITRMHHMFNWRGSVKDSHPYLFIGSKCEKQWWEFQNLVYKLDDNENKNADEDVVKRNDHAFDETKYALLSMDLPAPVKVDSRAGFATLKTLEDEIEAEYAAARRGSDFDCSFADLDDDY